MTYEVEIDKLCIIFSYILHFLKVLFWLFWNQSIEVQALLETTVIAQTNIRLSGYFVYVTFLSLCSIYIALRP